MEYVGRMREERTHSFHELASSIGIRPSNEISDVTDFWDHASVSVEMERLMWEHKPDRDR
jgi:hypothetical protein